MNDLNSTGEKGIARADDSACADPTSREGNGDGLRRVLITGGAGFLGSHLCDRFLAGGWQVIALDNLLTGSPDHIGHLVDHPGFRFIHYNVTQYLYFTEPIDLILHFACPASPLDYAQFPIQTMKVDSLGTLNSLGLARAKNARVVFASSSEVYGEPQVHPQPESYWGYVNPVGPRSVYTESKRFSEAMCMAYHRQHDLDVRIARIFNTYGTRMRMDDGRVVPTFISRALKGQPIALHGSGDQTRSFCHVDDLVEGIFRLSVHPDLGGEVINLGNPEEVTIRRLAQLVLEQVNSSSSLDFRDLPLDDPARRRPDITRARRLLGFKPEINLESGLSQVILWIRERL